MLSDTTGGGTWSASNGNVTVGTDGTVTGVISGTSVITYTTATGCTVRTTVTVNTVSSILGGTVLCSGSTLTLSDGTSGGSWTSSNGAVATVGSTGSPVTVTGISAGTTIISYTTTSGCSAGTTISVTATPTISGTASVCIGLTTTLSGSISGGAWSSSGGAATVGSSNGIVTGVSAGVPVITYMVSGCKATQAVTVSSNPAAITGSSIVCNGSTIALTDGSAGGSWSVDANATVDGSGNVLGTSAGVANVTYMFTDGCMASKAVTVAAQPTALSGVTLCAGSTLTLSDGTGGGTWSSSNTAVATIGASSGILSGMAGGTANITYITAPGTGCMASATVTVQALLPITGNPYICVGGTDTLILGTGSTGGSWSTGSSNISIDTTGLSTGQAIITGLSTGTASVTYTLPSGCSRSISIYVNAPPAAVSGGLTLCVGTTTLLSDAGSGTWTSGYGVVASVGSATGIVTGNASGTATITYNAGPGCISTAVVTVNPSISTISGPSSVCVGSTIVLIDTASGGTWSSNNSAIASVNGTGGVTGITTGSTTITYMNTATGCYRTYPMNVNPDPSAITGILTTCVGGTTTLNDTTSGSLSWSSSSTSVATVSGDVVTGVTPGTATITYKITSGCSATVTVTVNSATPAPTAAGGVDSTCAGSSDILLSDATTPGAWSSSNTAIATVSSGGVVTGVSGGTATIYYSPAATSGCMSSIVVRINSVAAISGSPALCSNGTTTLNDATSGGTWSSSNTGVATVGTNGTVSGVAAGTVTISYTSAIGCVATELVTVNAAPASITGIGAVCQGQTLSLGDASTGGTWSSSNTGQASVGSSSGVVTGIIIGTATISYTIGSTVYSGSYGITPTVGCSVTTVVTINAQPGSILGTLAACAGSTTTLSDVLAGGSWSTIGSALAIGASSGVVTAGASGDTATVSYTTAAGCSVSSVFTVNTSPAAIGGPGGVCAGSVITLTESAPGGTWSASNGEVTVDGSGDVTADSDLSGTVVITYTLPGNCRTTTTITITNIPSAIQGNISVCQGTTSALSDEATGGIWTSTGSSITIGSSSGIVTGSTVGTGMITYSVGPGCTTTATVTVNPDPEATSGGLIVCAGMGTTLSDTGSGVWTSSNTAIATVGSATGIITTTAAGTVNITYTVATGCTVVSVLTVNANPAIITGATSECAGNSVTLSDATAGGTWSAGNGNVSVSGPTVTGITAGSSTISYILPTGCYATYPNTVLANPTAITGTLVTCIGGTTTLTDATSGVLSWTSSSTGVATTSGDVVTGVSNGTATITYKVTSGCIATAVVTVNNVPVISGYSGPVCPGIPTPLAGSGGSGAWSSSNGAIATVGAASGILSGVSGGTAMISYSPAGTSGCTGTQSVSVNAAPAITGGSAVCAGSTITLTDASAGGAWNSSNTAAATISAGGIVSGVAAGTTLASYTTTTGCVITATITVNPVPAAISGATALCQGSGATLSDATGSGTWSSNNGIVTVVGSTGAITGAGTGTSVISYTLSTGCAATSVVTVSAPPTGILGASSLCAGTTATLSDGTTGGVWTATGAATVGAGTGVVTGTTAGTATISYTVGSCSISKTITVNASPAAITNNATVCVGSTNLLSDATSGGTWTSGNTAVATVNAGSGLVTGVAGGIAVISYTGSNGCGVAATVNVATAIGSVSGSSSACVGSTITLSDATSGGTWSASNGDVTLTGTATTTVSVTGASAGVVNITYTGASGCAKAVTVTVNASPSITSATFSLCASGVTTLTATPSGGTWSLGSSLVASVGSASGVLTASGTYTGTTTISYSNGGCAATHILTVNANPGPVQGSSSECAGVSITLSDATAGGVWTASNGNVSISGSTVTAVTAGTSTITYTIGTGCYATYPNTIYANPAGITGTLTVCQGSTTTLTDATGGGLSWTSGSTGVATTSGDVVTGVSAGTAVITYKVTAGSCYTTAVVTVNPIPSVTAISGPSSVVFGSPVTLSDATAGGVWTSSNTSAITLSGSTGSPVTATAVTATGSSVISYAVTNGSGCTVTVTKSMSATEPHPGGTTTGSGATLYVGGSVLITDDQAGGVWSSSNTGVATVDNSGLVTAVAAGMASITHTGINDQGHAVTTITPVVVSAVPASVSLLPNPNKGTFTVKGTLGSVNDEAVTLEVTDVLGQVIYKTKVTAQGGRINETVTLANTLANGMYILNVQSGTENKTFHFVIEQ
jgi:uncharacterized protein YjdB